MSYQKLGELLVAKGYLSNLQLSAALAAQETSHRRLGEILAERRYVTRQQIAECLSEQYGYPIVDLNIVAPSPEALALIPAHFALEREILPLAITETDLDCAIGDPVDILATDELAALTKKRVRLSVAVEDILVQQIKKLYGVEDEKDGSDFKVLPPSRYSHAASRRPVGILNWVDATDVHLGRSVTLLCVPVQSDATMPLLRRTRTVAQAVHPNLVGVFDWFEHNEHAWVSVERLEGETLGRILKLRGPRSLVQSAELVASLAEAVDAVHRNGSSVGILTPSNVWVRPGDVKLAPFCAPEAEYGSPEATDGAPTQLGDIYALGTILWECLTGTNPHLALSAHNGRKSWAEPGTHMGDIPAQMIEILGQCLSIEPEDRYTSALQLARALRSHNWHSLIATPKTFRDSGDDRNQLLSMFDQDTKKPSFWQRLFGRAA